MIGMALATGACTTYGVIENRPLAHGEGNPGYTLGEFARNLGRRSDELTLGVAFSGGGTRAAALSYGVMLELRDTRVLMGGKEQRLLDAVSAISSVSGGSFTSAYYGLYGDRLFVDFEERFLRRDVEGVLLRGLLNPLRWFSSRGRTEMAVAYYQESLFGAACKTLPGRSAALHHSLSGSDSSRARGLGARAANRKAWFSRFGANALLHRGMQGSRRGNAGGSLS